MGSVAIGEQLRAANVSLRAVLEAFAAGVTVGCGELVVLSRETQDLADMVCTLTVGGFAVSGRFRDEGHVDMGSWLAHHTNARQSEGLVRREQLSLLNLLPSFCGVLVSG